MTIFISTAVGTTTVNSEDVFVTQTGVVSGFNGLLFNIGGTTLSAVVAGAVVGSGQAAVLNGNDLLTVTATGTISGRGGNGADAVRLTGTNNIINVQGSVIAADFGIQGLSNFSNFSDSQMRVTVAAGGTVQGGSNGNGLDVGAYSAAIASEGTAVIENAGTIIADFNPDNGERIAILNASEDGFLPLGFDPSPDTVMTVRNSGTIFGDVVLGGGEDTYVSLGAGVLDGFLDLGDGEDILLGGISALIATGGAGNDTMRGSTAADNLSGDAGADTIWGGDGDDTIDGGNNPDVLRGGDGDDLIFGQNGGDTMLGGDGDDRLFGGNSDGDLLRGGDGDDTLDGGAGQDTLFGGDGADVFVFEQVSHTAVGSTRDRIIDFEQDDDLIDLSNLPGLLNFIGTAVFSGTAREVRLSESASGNTIVQIDADADGHVDAQILVAGVTGLTEDDFLL